MNSRGWLWKGWTGWNGLWSWEGILEAACEEDGQAGAGPGAGSGKEFSKLPGWSGWNWLWHCIWERILEAACEEDGVAGTGSGAGAGKEFSRLAVGRMERLERALDLVRGRNSRGCLRRGWTGWDWFWHWSWEGILEAACEDDGKAGTGPGAGSRQGF